ncbi:unnamed protein product (macronuclear) [Paramecium tetraurelia]|uniref:Uncharacterized protein n=1 Tax=Paramecium tetraurelia TaxID=5888 RepID=A0EC14_PARTE|nr:uncharacterized protein GSPATT00025567001 [Paramecium tetraurelia]CAK92831.1 unnamed protein product [Paramecium tetraurelia]|eukprot:XP_001460228.1 hypothetical protein (macronuclear) [Paramecium tetraurelia strain d4-2]
MTQAINTDLLLRMSTLNQEFHVLATNTNLFMSNIQELLLQQRQENQTSRQICDLNTQSVTELRCHLDQAVGNLYKKYEEQVNDKIKEFEGQQKQKEILEQNRIKELEQRFNQYDDIIKELDKKWESKSNDRYIASIIQKNLLTNQNIGQFIVDKVLKLTEETVQNKLNDYQKLIDERMTNQFHQLSNYQIQIRKCETKQDELQNQLNISKEFQMDFQKQQQKKLQVLQHQNSLFKEVVQQQVHNIIEQSELSKLNIKDLREQMIKQFEDASVGKLENNEQIMHLLTQDQQKIRELERKQDLIFKNENEIKFKLEQIQQDYSQQNQRALNQIVTMDSEMKNINSAINGIYEKVNTITLNPQAIPEKQPEKPQEKFKPLLISQKIQKQFCLKDQIGQIEGLFRHVQLLFTHICKTYRYEQKMESQKSKQKSDLTRNNSNEQIQSDNMDHPQYVFQHYQQLQKQEQFKSEIQKTDVPQQQIISPQNQLKINIQPVYQSNEDYFGDTRLYFNQALKPLYIQGKCKKLVLLQNMPWIFDPKSRCNSYLQK